MVLGGFGEAPGPLLYQKAKLKELCAFGGAGGVKVAAWSPVVDPKAKANKSIGCTVCAPQK